MTEVLLMKDRRKFSREFKLAAVKKVVEQGLPAAEVARDLGIRDSLLHNWKRKFETEAALTVPKNSVEEELQRLREENRRLKIERDILKKATVFFAKEKG
jgi:transposase